MSNTTAAAIMAAIYANSPDLWTTVAYHPDFGVSSDVEVYRGHNNRAFVGGHWVDPLHHIRTYANLPADEVTVYVAKTPAEMA